MQTLDVISVNLWQILISLLNLTLLFFIIKKFLYGPVKKVLAKRQSEIDSRYSEADEAKAKAESDRAMWSEKLEGAKDEADAIVGNATDSAKARSERIIADAERRADEIIRAAEVEAALERKKAADGIKREIVEVSGALSEKLLEREINTEDHRALIDSFIEGIGDEND